MKVYLSSQWSRRDEVEGYAVQLRADGLEVVSRWHSELMGDDNASDESDWMAWAAADCREIQLADAFLAFTEPPGTMSRGGRHVEWGFALAAVGQCIVVGPVESQFYVLANGRFETFPQFVQWMRERQASR